jgi:hypothetical protein
MQGMYPADAPWPQARFPEGPFEARFAGASVPVASCGDV